MSKGVENAFSAQTKRLQPPSRPLYSDGCDDGRVDHQASYHGSPHILSLKGDYAFRRLKRGGAASSKHVSIRWLPHRFRRPESRAVSQSSQQTSVYLGIITSKKIGKAVVRNKARRRCREALRTILSYSAPRTAHTDLVIMVRTSATQVDYQQLKTSLEQALKRGKFL